MGVYKNNNGNLELISGATLWADAPIGVIQAFGGSAAPNGWLLCQGQALSRTEYAELFAVIGTNFGSGDGSTTFNLPDPREAALVGAGQNTLKAGSIATHDTYSVGEFKDDQLQEHQHYRYSNDTNGSFYAGTGGSGSWTPSSATGQYGNSIGHVSDGRKGTTTHGKQLGVNFIIKAQQTALPADFMDALDDKQDATDNNLETTDKTIVGAINEINNSLTEFHTVSGITTSGGGNLVTNYNYGEYVLIPICAYGTNDGGRVNSLYPITRVMNDNKLGFHILSDDLDPVAKVNYAVTVEFLLIKI